MRAGHHHHHHLVQQMDGCHHPCHHSLPCCRSHQRSDIIMLQPIPAQQKPRKQRHLGIKQVQRGNRSQIHLSEEGLTGLQCAAGGGLGIPAPLSGPPGGGAARGRRAPRGPRDVATDPRTGVTDAGSLLAFAAMEPIPPPAPIHTCTSTQSVSQSGESLVSLPTHRPGWARGQRRELAGSAPEGAV